MGDLEDLARLEESLWRATTRYDPAHLEAVLAPGFVEFGRSGHVYDREGILGTAPVEFTCTLPLPGLEVRMLAADVALVTYRSEVTHDGETLHSNRSSVWRRGSSGWLLEFHQGTPVS